MICCLNTAGFDARFRECRWVRLFIRVPPFLKYIPKAQRLFGHKKSENNNHTIKAIESVNELRTGVILAEDTKILIKQKMPVHNRPHGAVTLLTSYKLNNLCNAEHTANTHTGGAQKSITEEL